LLLAIIDLAKESIKRSACEALGKGCDNRAFNFEKIERSIVKYLEGTMVTHLFFRIAGCLLLEMPLRADEDAKSFSVLPALEAKPQLQKQNSQNSRSWFRWKHKLGARVGITGLEGDILAIFLESQFKDHWSIRAGVEFATDEDSYYDPPIPYNNINVRYTPKASANTYMSRDPDYSSVNVRSKGLAVDFIYYTMRSRTNGAGFFLLAGLGVHETKVKEEYSYSAYSSGTLAISTGLGYIAKYIGFEIKHTTSDFSSHNYKNAGREWVQLCLNFRFNFL